MNVNKNNYIKIKKIKFDERYSIKKIELTICEYIKNLDFNKVLILCVGTTKITGDSLGPTIGTMLSEVFNGYTVDSKKIQIYGTLDSPLNAKNLENIHPIIMKNKDSLIIAIDAALSSYDAGTIVIKNTTLHPGSAINNRLLPIGNISILGIVDMYLDNESTAEKFFRLKNVEQSFVIKMAKCISLALSCVLNEILVFL